jgi:hypothetical protein
MPEQRTEPSAEVKAYIGEFVRIQREKYGEDWKKVLAAEMAAKTAPVMQAFIALQKSRPR